MTDTMLPKMWMARNYMKKVFSIHQKFDQRSETINILLVHLKALYRAPEDFELVLNFFKFFCKKW